MAIRGSECVEGVYAGLRRLEYRGYDSCGIAIKDDKIKTFKTVGYVENLLTTGVLNNDDSIMAIGHTRWATHGGVSENNSHPHISGDGNFAVVHNGILENYANLKETHLEGVTFASETDTEVIPHLVEKFYNGNVWDAFVKAISLCEGSYAVVMISSYDNNLYFARKSSPLLISQIDTDVSFASDINGFKHKNKVCVLPDNTIGYYDENVNVFDNNLTKINIAWDDYSNTSNSADLGDYPHYMFKEINEIPSSLRATYDIIRNTSFDIPRKIDNVLFVCCGTSYHSSLMGKKYIESISGIPTECIIASEFIYSDYLIKPHTLAIFISQSGETADTLSALRRARDMGLFTLAITNVQGSTITRLADSVVYINVGPEICVASTKAYTSQVLTTLLLSNILLNNVNGNYSTDYFAEELSFVEWENTIDYIGISKDNWEELFDLDISAMSKQAEMIADKLCNLREIHLIGKDYDYITAMEGSLKIKEVTYIFTDAYACGELKHGTLSLIDDNSYVISIITSGGIILDKTRNAMHEVSARGGKCIVVSQISENDIGGCDALIVLPKLHRCLMPIASIVPIDLIAYYVSISRGINPDKPRNLAKSVTVE